jgi:pyruvate kinase
MGRKVKIVATIGPSSQDISTLEGLIRAGMDVARLNFSHGTHSEHAAHIADIRQVARGLGISIAILQDLQGPKIRVGALESPLTLTAGQTVTLYAQENGQRGNEQGAIPVDFHELFTSVRKGDRVLLDDGRLALTVLEVGESTLQARVDVGGILSAHKGINLPGVYLDIPGFTAKDREDLAFGLSQGVEAVAVSFVRAAEDVEQVRQAIEQETEPQERPWLIAKLEKPEGLDNLEAILDIVDGVMVARGDLGVEMPPENVPIAQKRIIQAANRKAKLVITATQMLDSMIHSTLPTRAEASDVANAVFDGTDAIMLSGETASGEHPLESVRMMDRIARQAEAHYASWGHTSSIEGLGHDDAVSLARAACEIAHDRDVAAIAVFTQTGRTAKLMSKARPNVPILAFTPEQRTYQLLAMMWGVIPHRVPFADTVESMLAHVEEALKGSGLVQPGQQVVMISGFPVGAMRPPNMALLHTVGKSLN